MGESDDHGGQQELRVKLLGGFQVAVGERVLGDDEWRLRKVKSVVKLLALAPDHRLHREQVMDTLWPDLDPTAASNNLRKALHLAAHPRACFLEPQPRLSQRSQLRRLVDRVGQPGRRGDREAVKTDDGRWTMDD
jgi:DNA-binding SARP family transcriptional activator